MKLFISVRHPASGALHGAQSIYGGKLWSRARCAYLLQDYVSDSGDFERIRFYFTSPRVLTDGTWVVHFLDRSLCDPRDSESSVESIDQGALSQQDCLC